MALFEQLLAAQQHFLKELMSKQNVVGVGLGYKDQHGEPTDELALVTLVEQKLPKEALRDEDLVPPEIDGAKTDVLEVGVMRAQVNSGPRDRWRPVIPPGVSIAHPMVTAGTYGAMVYDRESGEPLLLSNNHVFAYSNGAKLDDLILQPGSTDGGRSPEDAVAKLARYWRLRFVNDDPGDGNDLVQPKPGPGDDGSDIPGPPERNPGDGCASFIVALGNLLTGLNNPNTIVATARALTENFDPAAANPVEVQAIIPENPLDAALARPINPNMFSAEIPQIGILTGTTSALLNMEVRKSGRTTGYTEGRVTAVNTVVDVGYTTAAGKQTARFTGQVMTTGMSQGGDSGSLIVDKHSQNAVGLLFAGSGMATVFTPIDVVLGKLNVRMTP